MIKLVRVLPENRELLWNLHQKYLYEMTKYYDNEMDENGNYHYGYFDAYFIQPERKAYFIYSDDRLAGFARYVISSADDGDKVSDGIIRRSMAKLAEQPYVLFRKAPGVVRIGLYGGIFAHSTLAREAFSMTLKGLMPGAEICAPEYPPELGAVMHLMQKRGILTEAALKNMKESYEGLRR